MNEEINQNNQKQEFRSQLLTVLCILTFIGSGISLFANGFLYITLDVVREAYASGMFEQFEGTFEMEAVELFLNVNPLFFLVQSTLYFFSIIGALQMWTLKKAGFHIYTISQISMLIAYSFFLPVLPFPFFAAFITLTFVLLYLRNLQFMR